MKTKITTKSKELNNLIEQEYFKLKEAIKKEHFSSKT